MSIEGGLRNGHMLMTMLAVMLILACYLALGVEGGNRCSERALDNMKRVMMNSNCGGRCNQYFRCQAGYNAVPGCRGQGLTQYSSAFIRSRSKAYNKGWIDFNQDIAYAADKIGRKGNNCEDIKEGSCTFNKLTGKC